jgi:acetyltransferase-like isoleucine patch superfamily enzyme
MILKKIRNAVKSRYLILIEHRRNKRITNSLNSCGSNLHVFGDINIIYPENVCIGDNCSMNHNAYINAFNPIHIGNDVTISAGAKLMSTGIDYLSWASGEKKHLDSSQDIYIGDHVWIGANAMILGGVSITGKYVVVAAGAVVTNDITKDYCVVGGCPAKIIKNYENELEV